MKQIRYNKIAYLQVIKKPKDIYTAVYTEIGDVQTCDYDDLIYQLSKTKKVHVFIASDESYTFNADEIKIIKIKHKKEWIQLPTIKEKEEFKNATLELKQLRKEKIKKLKIKSYAKRRNK